MAAERPVDHEKSYRGVAPRAFFHRARLRAILRTLRSASLGTTGRLADFGCSNGFILSELRATRFAHPNWELWGFDHAPHYIAEASRRALPGARFAAFDLDVADAELPEPFDVVLCLETLEHTGDYRTGLRNLARATRPGGYLVLSVPNECGVPGLVKYFGRKLLMRQSYEGFFRGRPHGPYVWALLRGADLEAFRNPPRHGWAEHLGFDVRRFEDVLARELVSDGSFSMIRRTRPALGFGRLYLLRRSA